MEDSGTSEEDMDSQDSNIRIDYGLLARNFSIIQDIYIYPHRPNTFTAHVRHTAGSRMIEVNPLNKGMLWTTVQLTRSDEREWMR